MLPYILLPRYFKLIGLIFFIGGYSIHRILAPDYSSITNGMALFVQCLILLGLLFMACAKEKIEDEMIRQIRLTSLQYTVVIFVLLRLGYKLIGYLTGNESWMPQFQANFLIFLFIIIFYFQNTILPWFQQLINKNNEK